MCGSRTGRSRRDGRHRPEHPLEPVIGPANGRTRWRMMTAERVEHFTGFILFVLDLFLPMWFHQTVPPDRGRSHEAHANGEDVAPEGSASSAGPPGASGDTARPNYMGLSGNGLVGVDERGGKPAESRAFRLSAAPVRFQKAVSGLRKNAAARRREARRSALWIGSSLPLEGQAQPQGGPTGAAIRARDFRRSASLFLRTRRVRMKIWDDSPPDAPRGNAPARLNKMHGGTTMPKLKKQPPRSGIGPVP